MDKRKDGLIQQMEKEERIVSYREKIVEMIGQIEDEKFLKRIFISLRDYINESK